MDQPRSDGGVLDLGRADAIARGLYHRIVAADEAEQTLGIAPHRIARPDRRAAMDRRRRRSEEHTSELQSLMRNSYAVFCLKKKNQPHAVYTLVPNIVQQESTHTNNELTPTPTAQTK